MFCLVITKYTLTYAFSSYLCTEKSDVINFTKEAWITIRSDITGKESGDSPW